MKLTAISTSFNGGELSRRMEGRVDTAIYQIGAAEMENFVPTVEGPAVKRPGYRYIRAAMASASWLSAFVYSQTQAYVIEWGEETLRFYTNGARIETAPDTAYEVEVPYAAAQAPFVSQQQSFDRLYMAHPSHPPAALTRTSATAFSHAALTLKNGPAGDQNGDETKTVTLSGTLTAGGTATVTASSAIFQAGHVGSSFMVEAKDFSDITAWEGQIDGIVANDSRRRSDGKAYLAETSGRTGTQQPTHSRGAEYDGAVVGEDINEKNAGGIRWRYLHDRIGIGTITAVGGGGTTATVTVTRAFPESLASVPSHRWSHAAISAVAGWPRIVLLAWGRLVFFTDFEIIASVAGDYGGGSVNFAIYTESGLLAPDMAFRKRLSISNPVLWAVEDKGRIIIGTAEREYVIQRVNNAEIVSGENIECIKQTRHGSAQVWPAEAGGEFLFVQRGGRKIREADYVLDRDGYAARNITVWARHITKSKVRQLAFEQEPEEMLWAVRGDGVLAAHPHAPEQEIKGWSRVTLAEDGLALSSVCIPTEDGGGDEQWLLVERDGARSVELRAPWWDEEEMAVEDAFFVDSGVSYDGAPLATFSTGLDHLAGKAVRVLADGSVVPGLTVSEDGELTLPFAASRVHVGLGYAARLKNLRPEVKGPNGSVQGKRKRFVSIVLRLLQSLGVQVDPGTGNPEYLVDREGSGHMDAAEPLFSGDTSNKAIGGNWERDGQATIISDDPLPCMVLAAMPSIEVTE